MITQERTTYSPYLDQHLNQPGIERGINPLFFAPWFDLTTPSTEGQVDTGEYLVTYKYGDYPFGYYQTVNLHKPNVLLKYDIQYKQTGKTLHLNDWRIFCRKHNSVTSRY